jgi:hypothetical protein
VDKIPGCQGEFERIWISLLFLADGSIFQLYEWCASAHFIAPDSPQNVQAAWKLVYSARQTLANFQLEIETELVCQHSQQQTPRRILQFAIRNQRPVSISKMFPCSFVVPKTHGTT